MPPHDDDPPVEAPEPEVIIEGQGRGWAGRIRARGKSAEGLKKAIDDVGALARGALTVLGQEDPIDYLSRMFGKKK